MWAYYSLILPIQLASGNGLADRVATVTVLVRDHAVGSWHKAPNSLVFQ